MHSRFTKNQTVDYFYAYTATLTCFGLIIGSLNTQIVQIRNKRALQGNQWEGYLSNLHYFRSIGFLIGGIIMNQFANKFKLHHIIIFGSLASFVGLSLFCICVEYYAPMHLFITLASCSMAMVIIPTNMNLINIHVTRNQQFWLLIGHSMFALGIIISPIFGDVFGTYTLMFAGSLLALASISYWFIEAPPSPPYASRVEYLMKDINQLKIVDKIENKQFRKPIQFRLLLIIFLTVGLQTSFTKNVNNFLFPSMNYSNILLALTLLSRIITPLLPGTPSQKIEFIIRIQVIVSLTSFMCSLLGYQLIAINIAVIGIGTAIATHFLLYLVLTFQFAMNGYNVQESGFVVISGTLGQLIANQILKTLVKLNRNFFFIFICLVACCLLFLFKKIKNDFVSQFKTRFYPQNQHNRQNNDIILTKS